MYAFTVMYGDIRVADIIIEDGKLIKYVLYYDCPFFYGKNIELTMERVFSFLETRIPPPERENIDEILEYYGLPEYNVYELCKKTHGVDCSDCCWLKFEGEHLTWKDVKPEWRR